jgi:hypothetical protein
VCKRRSRSRARRFWLARLLPRSLQSTRSAILQEHAPLGEEAVDFVFDYISVNAFWTIVLIVHGLLAVATLGALTHQAMSVGLPVRQPAGAGFLTRFRAVPGANYATAVCVLWVITALFGAWIYTKYRIAVRIPMERLGFWKTLGFFELKEHVVALGLGLLPAYWYFWKNAANPDYDGVRKWLTICLAAMCWFAFLVGHVVNNVRGFGS